MEQTTPQRTERVDIATAKRGDYVWNFHEEYGGSKPSNTMFFARIIRINRMTIQAKTETGRIQRIFPNDVFKLRPNGWHPEINIDEMIPNPKKPSEQAWELFMTIQKIPDTVNCERNYLRDTARRHIEAVARELEVMESMPEGEAKSKA